MASSLLPPGVEGGGGCGGGGGGGGGVLLLLQIASLCVTSGVSANNVTETTTTTTTQSNIAETTASTTTAPAPANDPTTSPAGAPTTGAATAAPTVTEAPATPVTTTADPEAGMFDCFYCGVEDPCDQPFVENFVGRMNKTSKCTRHLTPGPPRARAARAIDVLHLGAGLTGMDTVSTLLNVGSVASAFFQRSSSAKYRASNLTATPAMGRGS